MTEINYETILKSFLFLNLEIESSFVKQPTFIDKEVEAQYLIQRNKNSEVKKILSDAFIIFCYIAIVVYIYVHDYDILFTYICSACLGISVILITLSYFEKSSSFNITINKIMVYALSIFLNFKIIYISCYHQNAFNDKDSEIIRTIIYEFLSRNILSYLTLDTKFSVNISLFLMNFSTLYVAQMKSNKKYLYYLDGITNVIVTFFFFMLRRVWEASDRATFAERHRFEKFFNYTRDYIQGTNGYYLNISKDFSVCCDSKMKSLLNEMQIDEKIGKFKNSDKLDQTYESIDEWEVNDLMTFNNLTPNKNYGNLSEDVLTLFTLEYDNDLEEERFNEKKETLLDKLKVLMFRSSSTTHFQSIGKYKVQSLVCTKYFDVHFRKFFLNETNSINDIQIYDVTELVSSRKKLWEEMIIKQKMMAKFVHEFKTPINSIIGVIGIIEDTMNSDNIQHNKFILKHLETARSLSRYVTYLISDIINFTNIKNFDEIKIESEKINLREIAYFCFDILKSLIRSNKSKNGAIQPQLEFDDNIDELVVKADENRLKQIILNYISNAVKFTKSGLIKLKCSISIDIGRVIISVIDTGIGIKKHQQEKLFNDFYMIDNENINNAMGSGLGLSISKNLAASMNIEVTTTSIYGKGSEFALEIPYINSYHLNEPTTHVMIRKNESVTDQENTLQLLQNKNFNEHQFSTDLSYQRSECRNEIVVPEFKIKNREVKYIKFFCLGAKIRN